MTTLWNAIYRQLGALYVSLVWATAFLAGAHAATCTTQSQMSPAQRSSLAAAARSILTDVQSKNIDALRADTFPAIVANFSGIVPLVDRLGPLVQPATITVDDLYLLDASGAPAALQTDFYCGSPVVVFHFTHLPAGTYALAILHATGAPNPQQVSLILAEAPDGRWMLAGMYDKPMMAAGHDGLWYWVEARRYARSGDKWDAWLYYRVASELLDPVSFLSSPNLETLQQESNQARPATFPGSLPMTLTVDGENFAVTSIKASNTYHWLDLDVLYSPDPTEAQQLRDSQTARQQAVGMMSALIELHPELQSAFHGIWIHAVQGDASLYTLELPMAAIVSGPHPTAAESISSAR